MHPAHTRPYVERYRPAPTWLAAGMILGPACGAAVGAALALPGSGDSYADAMIFGGFWGGFFGAIIGTIVGFIMTFAVGPHLPDQQARERAFLVNFCITGLLAFAVLGLFFAFHPIALGAAFISALTGGALSYWLAPLLR